MSIWETSLKALSRALKTRRLWTATGLLLASRPHLRGCTFLSPAGAPLREARRPRTAGFFFSLKPRKLDEIVEYLSG